ncbi:MAG: hypothetical protein ABIP95_10710 [Pelobium sp.]
MTKIKVHNLDQLQLRIAQLKIEKAEQEIFFNQKWIKTQDMISSPINFVKGLLTTVGLRGRDKNNATPSNADWATNLARVSLPFLLNRTILRGRGFILKSLVTLISQNTINAKSFNKNKLAGWIDNITGWVDGISSKKTKKRKLEVDYGIPEDSETYSGGPVH